MKAPLLGSANATAPEFVAQIGEKKYATLQAALDAAVDGDTVTLIEDIGLGLGNVVKTTGGYSVLLAVENKSVTLDMNGKTINANYDNNSLLYAVVYVGDGAGLNIIGNGSIDLTMGGTMAGKYRCVAYMFWKHGTTGSLNIENGNYHANNLEDSMIYTNGDEIVTVNGGTYIIDKTGEREHGCPWIFNTAGGNDKNVIVTGGAYNVDVSNQYWKSEVQLGEGLIVQKRDDMYHVIRPVLTVKDQLDDNEVYYGTLTEAIEAAEDGDTITLKQDISVNEEVATDLGIAKLNSDIPTDSHVTLFNVSGKEVTIDLNGNDIYADVTGLEDGYSLAGLFSTKDGGNLILKDTDGSGSVDVNAVDDEDPSIYANVFAMIINLDLEEGNSSITIEGGNYHLDRGVSSMIDTRSNEGVTVKGGTFVLDNVFDETLSNGQAWMFNAKGQNTRHVIVEGGSFNVDVQHQYYPFEVSMAKELALKEENGMFTVVPAVAYVNEQEFSGRWYTNEIGYATLEEAYAAVEAPKTSWDGQVSAPEYVTSLTDGIEINEDGTITITGDHTVFDLGGETLNFTANNAITVKANNVVIDGTVEGSGITVNAPAGQKATVINVESGSCTVNGGIYTANTFGAGTVNNYVPAVYVKTGATLNVNGATILAKDNGEKGFAVGIQAMGNAEISNATVIAEANYVANAAGSNYGSSSRGIYSEADLKLNNCYVWGAHSGVTSKGSVYVDGGTYEGYGHGGVYLSGAGTTSYFYNATINWAPMREGTVADTVAGTNGSAFYIGGGSSVTNVSAYIDSCTFNTKAGINPKDDTKIPYYAIVLRNSSKEKNNCVYMSNSTVMNATKYAFRTNNGDNTVYSGVGNNFAQAKKDIDYASRLVETNASYAEAE